MANQYQEDLKLIVGIEGSKSGNIPAHKPKDKIKGKRGIVYFNADGSTSSTTGNTPGTDEEGNKEEGTTQPAAGGTDTGTSGGAYNGGNTTADAGLTDPYPVDDTTLPGAGIYSVDSMTLGDIVKGVSGLKDCATDQPVDVRFDGQFTAPDGWESPADGPLPDGYEAGYYFRNLSGGTSDQKFYTPSAAANAVPPQYLIDEPGQETCTIVSGPTYGGNDTWHTTYHTTGQYEFNFTWSTAKAACGSDTSTACTVSPAPSQWPAETPTQLSFNAETGLWETHPMDGNVLTQYSQPVSSIALCNENGDPIKTYQLADGGQAIYNETTGIATFIDADGKVTGFGGAAEITNRQPR